MRIRLNNASLCIDNIPNGVYYKGVSNKLVNNDVQMEVLYMSYDAKALNRIKRIEGQLRGILRMMEEEKDCKEVITQLSAVRSAVDRTIGVIVSDNLLECVQNADGNTDKMNSAIQEAVNLVVKSR